MLSEALVLLNKIDERTKGHSEKLNGINNIDANIARVATTLEGIMKRFLDVLEGKSVVSLKGHILTVIIIGVMFIIGIVAANNTSFRGKVGSSEASIGDVR